MFGIGMFELTVIAIVALVFVGPQKLPDLARQFGRFFVQIRRATGDVRATVDQFVRDAEEEIVQEERENLRKLLQDTTDELDLGNHDGLSHDDHHDDHAHNHDHEDDDICSEPHHDHDEQEPAPTTDDPVHQSVDEEKSGPAAEGSAKPD